MVVGKGDDVDRLKHRAREAGLGDRVHFLGFVPDHEIGTVYCRAAVFAMLNLKEGFWLVYLEAMQHHLPCVGATDDAGAEIIADGETGFVVPQKDIDALADRLILLLRDPGLRATMGDAGFRRATEVFSYQRFRQRFLSILEDHELLPGR